MMRAERVMRAAVLVGAWLIVGPGCPGGATERIPQAGPDPRASARMRMVDEQIAARGITDARVLDAMRRVPRHRFVPAAFQAEAYDDHPLPIGHGQTISQPYIVAYMTEALAVKPGHRVLEVGTGSAYQAAVLGELAAEVYTIEIVSPLARQAQATLTDLGYRNVHAREGDGYGGWPEHAPFDGIMVTAAPDHVPQPLVDQLAAGGRLVIPVGRDWQEMVILTKTATGVTERRTIPVRFVPLTRSQEQGARSKE